MTKKTLYEWYRDCDMGEYIVVSAMVTWLTMMILLILLNLLSITFLYSLIPPVTFLLLGWVKTKLPMPEEEKALYY